MPTLSDVRLDGVGTAAALIVARSFLAAGVAWRLRCCG
jgi:hypothetical protein